MGKLYGKPVTPLYLKSSMLVALPLAKSALFHHGIPCFAKIFLWHWLLAYIRALTRVIISDLTWPQLYFNPLRLNEDNIVSGLGIDLGIFDDFDATLRIFGDAAFEVGVGPRPASLIDGQVIITAPAAVYV